MAVEYVGAGATTKLKRNSYPDIPAPEGIQAGDLLLLCYANMNDTVSVTSEGWTEITEYRAGEGAAGGATSRGVQTFYKYSTGSETVAENTVSGMTINTTNIGVMLAFRGVHPSNPVHTGAVTDRSSGNPAICNAVTTTVTGTMLVFVLNMSVNWSGDSLFSNWTNANLTSITECADRAYPDGDDCSIGVACGLFEGLGDSGTTSVDLLISDTSSRLTLALAPIPTSGGMKGIGRSGSIKADMTQTTSPIR